MIRKLLSTGLFWLNFLVTAAALIFLSQYYADSALQGQIETKYGLGPTELPFKIGMLAIGQCVAFLLAYLVSLNPRAKSRPYLAIIIGSFAFGATGGASGYAIFESFGTMGFLSALGGGVASVAVIMGFEFFNRWFWQSIVERLDKRNLGGAALLVSRLALLWRPGQDALLSSVSIELFRRGQRGEVSERLEAYYEEGHRSPELLECLCQNANEQKNSARYLQYLGDLFQQFPEDDQLRDAYTDELLEHKKFEEAVAILDKHGSSTDVDSLEKQAILMMETKRFDDATVIAAKLAEEEGIPMRRSDAVLRRVLGEEPQHLEAINLLADHSRRMARKDQQIRWLDQSILIDPSQKRRGDELLDLLKSVNMSQRIEEILSLMVKAYPEDLALSKRYAESLHANGKLDDSISYMLEVRGRESREERQVRDFDFLFFMAKVTFENKRLQLSHQVLKQSLALELSEDQENQATVLLKKVERAEFTNELADMLDQCQRNPHNLELMLEAVERLVLSGHFDRAIAQGDLTLANHPAARSQVIEMIQKGFEEIPEGGYTLLSYLADLQVAGGNYDEALETVKMMADRSSLNKETAIREGAQKILRRSPHHLKTLRTVGEMYHDLGQFTEMIHSYSLYLSNGGEENEQIDRALAQAYMALNDYASARRFVLHLLQTTEGEEADVLNIEMLNKVIPMAIESNHAVDAKEFMEKLDLMDPKNKNNKSMRLKVDDALGEQRFEFLKKELDKGNVDENALEELGDLRLEAEDYNAAITYFQRAARRMEKSRIPQAKLAYAFAKKRMFDLASETMMDLRLSLDDDPEELESLMSWLYKTAEALEHANMYNSASKLFKQLMKIDAGYRDVIQKVERLGMK